ncbi:MAG: methyltransferase [Verrucomicrobiota bacterium]
MLCDLTAVKMEDGNGGGENFIAGTALKTGEKNVSKELYHQLRVLTWEKLWTDEVPRFNKASPKERSERVALVRAVGVVFFESGDPKRREEVKLWLMGLLHDPCEKIRRYAMAALPKIGAGPDAEAELLALLRNTSSGREKKFLVQALEKIGGTATLETMKEDSRALPPLTEQKLKASIARSQSPSAIRLDGVLSDFAGLRVHLRGRRGLEAMVRDEAEQAIRTRGQFRLEGGRVGLVALTPLVPFTLSDIYALRCFGDVGFVPGGDTVAIKARSIEALAPIIASALSRRVLQAFTEGSIRYRLNFVGKGHQRGAVRLLAGRVYELCPEMLNDARNVTWTVDIYPDSRVELRPNLTPDPRFYYRRRDVPAASHPPLAACMARLAGLAENEIVWDPFCGSGLELIERALLGGVRAIHGTDLSAAAIAIARDNFAAVRMQPVPANFVCKDFRDYAGSLGPNSLTLVITNPPMGMRVPVPDLHGLIEELFNVAATVLRPGGRLILANPISMKNPPRPFQLLSRQTVDLGGFDCLMEKYVKVGR